MLIELVERIAQRMLESGRTMAVAESCTGGWLAKVCTDLPGSSAWFDSGFVTYSNRAKEYQLEVPAALIAEFGAVSEPVVEAMLDGVLKHSQVDVAVAISGIAGPAGGSAEKPVGTVVIGWKLADEICATTTCFLFSGDRNQIREQSVLAALQGLDRRLG